MSDVTLKLTNDEYFQLRSGMQVMKHSLLETRGGLEKKFTDEKILKTTLKITDDMIEEIDTLLAKIQQQYEEGGE